MKAWIFICVPIWAIASVALMGCDVPPLECTRLCDRVYYAEELRADLECGGLRTEKSDAKEACRDSCHDEWDDASDDNWDKTICLDCINDDIGTRPCWDRVEWVIEETCLDDCGSDFDFAWDLFYDDWIAKLEYREECD